MSEPIPLGKLIDGEAVRDAVHFAIAPVVAAERLSPGQDIGLTPDGRASHFGNVEKMAGIVDPFLRSMILPGQRFFMVLYPNTVTGMRHHWEHPAFDARDKTPDHHRSEAWLRNFASQGGVSYERLLEIIRSGYAGNDDDVSSLGVPDELYPHYENVTGITVPEGERQTYFRCAC